MYQIPGASQQAVNVHGLRIAYRKVGDGPPVLLLHGLAYSSLTWAANMPALARRFAVYAPDLPGHGDSDRHALPYDFRLGVTLLGRLVDRLGLRQVMLVGHSMGGALALQFALDHPSRVPRLVLVDAAGLGQPHSPFLWLMSLPLLGRLLFNGRLITVGGVGKRLFRRPERVDHRLLRALHRARTVQLAGGAVRSMARASTALTGLRPEHGLLSRLGELQMPALVVWGERDRLLPVEHARQLARRYPRIPVRVLPDVGHWPHMEDAEAFNQLLVQFLVSGNVSEAG